MLFRHHASGRDELPPMSMGAKRRCLPQTTCSRCKFSSQCLLWRRSTAKLITARWVRASSTDGEPTTTSTNLAGNFPSLHPRRPKPKPKPVSVCGVADTCSRDAAAGALLAVASPRRCISASPSPQVVSKPRRDASRSPSCACAGCPEPSDAAVHVTRP